MRTNAFGGFHPVVNFAFFACAIALGMFVRHPAFHVVAVSLAALYYLTLRGRSGMRTLPAMAVMFAVLSLANPLFNTMGDTVLFVYASGRAFTWEALLFGMSTAAMFVSTMLWFACFNAVMTTDKLTFLFGGVAPSLSLVLTMVLRLVPHYQRKTRQIIAARACMGGSVREKANAEPDRARKGSASVRNGAAALSALTTWAFEQGIVTADSMRSRGYGVARRSSFASYAFGARDACVLAVVALLTCVVAACLALGAADAEYLPAIVFPEASALFAAGVAGYAALCALPVVVNVKEAVLWRISLSSM